MAGKSKIVIADRNRNVRSFLQRELAGEGYQVRTAADERELLHLLEDEGAPDLLLLDPEIPSYVTEAELIALLHSHHPALPIVIHTFLTENHQLSQMAGVIACLEKGADVTFLKKVIAEVVKK